MKDTNISVDIGNNTTDLIEGLAQQLGVTASELLPYYEQAIVTENTWYIGILVIFGMVASITFLAGLASRQDEIAAGSLFLGVIAFVFFLVSGSDAIAQAKHPKKFAVQEMMEDASNLVPKGCK